MYNVIVFFEGKPGKSPIEHVYNNVPEGVTSEQVAARARAEYPNETVVELKRYKADRSDISGASSVTDAPPASQAVTTRGDAVQSTRDTERLRLLESEPPSITRDREIALLKQGRGAYPNLTGLNQVGVVPAAPVAPAAPAGAPATPQKTISNYDLEGAGPGGQIAMTWRLAAGNGSFGIFHFAGGGAVTRFEFADAIFARAAARGGARPALDPATSAEFPVPARPPATSALNCARLARDWGILARPWRAALDETVDEILAGGSEDRR